MAAIRRESSRAVGRGISVEISALGPGARPRPGGVARRFRAAVRGPRAKRDHETAGLGTQYELQGRQRGTRIESKSIRPSKTRLANQQETQSRSQLFTRPSNLGPPIHCPGVLVLTLQKNAGIARNRWNCSSGITLATRTLACTETGPETVLFSRPLRHSRHSRRLRPYTNLACTRWRTRFTFCRNA